MGPFGSATLVGLPRLVSEKTTEPSKAPIRHIPPMGNSRDSQTYDASSGSVLTMTASSDPLDSRNRSSVDRACARTVFLLGATWK